jgi:ATP-dependent RNA helicase RhlE
MPTFQELNLKPQILSALDKKGYTNPTPIQEQAIPYVLEKRDLLGVAQTGTGKTAAFSLPILQNLSESNEPSKPYQVRCLILTPTRELASQIAENIEAYGSDLNLKHAVIFGGVGGSQQIKNLEKGLDIVIATPGRLLDLMSQGYVRFSQLEILVLDEADRMLDMGFIEDVKKIISKMPKERQTLFFSATMPSIITYLAKSILDNPVRIEVTPPASTVDRIDQKIYLVERSNKTKLLKHVLEQDPANRILVFFRTKSGADRLNDFLERNGVEVETIHGDKSQSARELALVNFREGKARVLIATDIAARGIDVPGITHVVNYDIPGDPESYVHRIGRTARAGKDGIAISFCDPTETLALKAIESTISYKIPVDKTHPFHGAEGISGVRKISSAKKSGTINPNTNKMTTEPKKMVTGRKISSAKDAVKKVEPKVEPQVESKVEPKVEVAVANSSESAPVAEFLPPKEARRNQPRKPSQRDQSVRSNAERKPRTQNDARKKPTHTKKKKGLVTRLVDKVKSILGIKKPAPKRHYKKSSSNNTNRSSGGQRRPQQRRTPNKKTS